MFDVQDHKIQNYYNSCYGGYGSVQKIQKKHNNCDVIVSENTEQAAVVVKFESQGTLNRVFDVSVHENTEEDTADVVFEYP